MYKRLPIFILIVKTFLYFKKKQEHKVYITILTTIFNSSRVAFESRYPDHDTVDKNVVRKQNGTTLPDGLYVMAYTDFEPGEAPDAPDAPILSYSNEWVTFLDKLVQDEKTREIAIFIKTGPLTDRAKKALTIYMFALLDKEFNVTNLQGQSDFNRIMSEKGLAEADLPLNLTKFDMNATYHLVLDLIRVRFTPKLFRSRKGFQNVQLTTQRSEMMNVEQSQSQQERASERSMSDRLRELMG